MVRLTDRPAMAIAVDLGCKATKQTNKQTSLHSFRTVTITDNITYISVYKLCEVGVP